MFLYEDRPHYLMKLVEHIASKSITEFLAKVLTFEMACILGIDEDVL